MEEVDIVAGAEVVDVKVAVDTEAEMDCVVIAGVVEVDVEELVDVEEVDIIAGAEVVDVEVVVDTETEMDCVDDVVLLIVSSSVQSTLELL